MRAAAGVGGGPPDAGQQGARMYKVISFRGDAYWISDVSVTDVSQTGEPAGAGDSSSAGQSAGQGEVAALGDPVGTVSSATHINVRAEPSMGGMVLGAHPLQGAPIYATEADASGRDWYQVQLPGGVTGWVAS